MIIDAKVEGVNKSESAKCFYDGQYHYRSKQGDKAYCLLSDSSCLFYKLGGKGEDFCSCYNWRDKK